MALPVSFASRTVADNTIGKNGQPELSTTQWAITTLTPGNAAAQETLDTALQVAIAGITLGVNHQTEMTYKRVVGSPSASSNPLAQRENKYLIRYHDVVSNQKMSRSFGTADLSLMTNNSEFLDLAGTEAAAVVVAFEAYVKSDFDPTHAVVVDSIQFVGRNT